MQQIDGQLREVTAFAPASIANVIVGFDTLGFPFPVLGDQVSLVPNRLQACRILEIEEQDGLPTGVQDNTAGKALVTMLEDLGLEQGFDIRIRKGIPIASGLGSSAASAVAAVMACNRFLLEPCTMHQLAEYASVGEQIVSGDWHIDNVAPALWGTLLLVSNRRPLEVTPLPMPPLTVSVVHPRLAIPTAQARSVLMAEVSLKLAVRQGFHLARFIHALHAQDWDLLQAACQDELIEPQRQHLLHGYSTIKASALDNGALCVGFAGAGPTLFAFSVSDPIAQNVTQAMVDSVSQCLGACDSWTLPLIERGAAVVAVR